MEGNTNQEWHGIVNRLADRWDQGNQSVASVSLESDNFFNAGTPVW